MQKTTRCFGCSYFFYDNIDNGDNIDNFFGRYIFLRQYAETNRSSFIYSFCLYG